MTGFRPVFGFSRINEFDIKINPAEGLDPRGEYSHCVTWSWNWTWIQARIQLCFQPFDCSVSTQSKVAVKCGMQHFPLHLNMLVHVACSDLILSNYCVATKLSHQRTCGVSSLCLQWSAAGHETCEITQHVFVVFLPGAAI